MMGIGFLRDFCRDEDGAALVEFGLLLPSLILMLGMCVEGGRTFWSYQTTVTGVRDATRYLSRVLEADICTSGGSSESWDETLTEIVRNAYSGESLFPSAVTVTSVTSALSCRSGDYRGGPAAVAKVTANLRIEYPFSGLVEIMGGTLDTVTTQVSDTARVLGT
jgi:Flp pilus assembly protein TadG